MGDDELRFGQVKEGDDGGSGGPLDDAIDIAIQLIALIVVLFMLYKVVETLLPLL